MELSAATISLKCGISRQTWYRLIKADFKHIRLETLTSIADVLQVSLVELSFLYLKEQQLQKKPFIQSVEINDTPPFVIHSGIHHELIVSQEESFKQDWELINTGTAEWKNRRLICADDQFTIHHSHTSKEYLQQNYNGLDPQQHCINIPNTAPGEHAIISTKFIAPRKPGTVISFWKMVDALGVDCFPENIGLSCQVRVIESITHLAPA